MRYGVIVAACVAVLLVGGTCLPLLDTTIRTPQPGRDLAISLSLPRDAVTVSQGDTVRIEWTGANLTGEPANVSIVVESREDLTLTTLASGIEFQGTGDQGRLDWDTTEFAGPYALTARIETAELSHQETGPELVTVAAAPVFEFTGPTTDTELDVGDSVLISWFAGGRDATAEIRLDTDTDHESGNEITIFEPNMPFPPADDSLVWSGTNVNGARVAADTYNLFATASNGITPDVTAEGLATITVLPDETGQGPEVIEPADDIEFTDADGSITIEYAVNSDEDALVDVRVDTDDTHTNGNEITVDAQRFVEADTDPDPFEWDGTDSSGNPVAYGIYRVFIAVSIGSGLPQRASSEGLVFRRSTDTQPLIALLTPATAQTVELGDTLLISWRDEDPEEDSTIRLIISENNDPAAPLNPVTILEDRDAAEDGVLDTFSWSVTGLEDAKTYYVIAYIERAGEESSSVAPGTLELPE